MPLTEINFKEDYPLYKKFAEGIANILDEKIGKTSAPQKEVRSYVNIKEDGWHHYDNYWIEFDVGMKSTFEVKAVGMKDFGFSSEKMKSTYDELLEYCKGFMKKHDINMFLSLHFYGFGDNFAENGFIRGATSFVFPEDPYKIYPLTEELKEIQKVAQYMGEFFPIVKDGKYIKTRKDKFSKEYLLDLVNEGGKVKVGIFQDDLFFTVGSKKEVDDLLDLKKVKLLELEKVKTDAIATLKKIDPTFLYDGKNGVVLLGSKSTINTEYDQFKQEYLMVFLKSKIKTKTLAEMEKKVNSFIVKKTT